MGFTDIITRIIPIVLILADLTAIAISMLFILNQTGKYRDVTKSVSFIVIVYFLNTIYIASKEWKTITDNK